MTPEQRDDIAEKHAFQPGERERIAAELAARAQQIAQDDALRWCRERNEAKRASELAAAEQPPKQDWKSKPDRSAMTDDRAWNDWANRKIKTAIKAHERSLLGAVGDVLHGEIKKLRDENAVLRERLDKIEQERGAPHLRAI